MAVSQGCVGASLAFARAVPSAGNPSPIHEAGILISCRGPSPTITHSESLPGSLFKSSGVSLVAQ